MSFDTDNYTVVKNFLNPEMCKVFKMYALFDELNNFRDDYDIPGTHSGYADSFTESLLLQLKDKMESITNCKLVPTYSYFRNYRPGDILRDHVDRNSCEISASITISFDYKEKPDDYRWPLHIYVKGKKKYLHCDVGDAVIYHGFKIEHGREMLSAGKGSRHIQIFLHYVDADGPYALSDKYDKRECIGIKRKLHRHSEFGEINI
jgi:hypothetical protein